MLDFKQNKKKFYIKFEEKNMIFCLFKSCILVQALFLLKLRYLPTLHFVTKIIKMKIKNTKLSENNRPIEKNHRNHRK